MMGSSKIEHKLPLQILEELALDQKPTIVMSEGHDPRIISGSIAAHNACLLYTSPSPRDRTRSRMPSSA